MAYKSGRAIRPPQPGSPPPEGACPETQFGPRPCPQGAEVYNHDAVLVVIDDLGECGDKLHPAFGGEMAAEDGVVDGIPEGLHCPVDLMQALWIHYVVADNVAFQLARRITLCRRWGTGLSLRIRRGQAAGPAPPAPFDSLSCLSHQYGSTPFRRGSR